MDIFKTRKEYKEWIEGQDWYQTIELSNGLITPGKVPTHLRTPFFEKIEFKGKTFIDVGCNSGQYCFLAKKQGATEVVGLDISKKRINQARTLAANEGYNIHFEEKGIFDLSDSPKKFDIVFCIAVLTEIQDTFGAIEQLKQIIGERAFIELDLAKPLIYLSLSKQWLKGYSFFPRRTAVAEVRKSKNGGWVVSPSLDVLRALFGGDFDVYHRKGGVRYDLIEVVRK